MSLRHFERCGVQFIPAIMMIASAARPMVGKKKKCLGVAFQPTMHLGSFPKLPKLKYMLAPVPRKARPQPMLMYEWVRPPITPPVN